MKYLAAAVVIVVAVAGAVAWFAIAPPDGGPFVVVISDTSPRGAGEAIKNAGAIGSAVLFERSAERLGTPIIPGRYVFSTGVYPWTAAKLIAKGPPPPPDILVTIPEGKRLPEIAKILEDSGIVDAREFLKLARAEKLEGYLFPDSYKFRLNTDAQAVIRRMHARFQEQIEGLSRPGMTQHQFVTLASIVEKEAKVPEERPRIAAVFLNRLARGMRLEADPTVRYAVDKWDTTPVLFSDLESPSPYNTYRVSGLPPGPIASVGRASMEAVARPLETNELFFVAREDGSHIFAETFGQHLRNIALHRRRVQIRGRD